MRNADLVTLDVAAIRASDHPASTNVGPNGMTAEHFCQLSRYIGMSDRLLATGFFEHNPDLDDRGRGAHLVAQGVWHVMDGIFNQKGDHPKCTTEDYLKYLQRNQATSGPGIGKILILANLCAHAQGCNLLKIKGIR